MGVKRASAIASFADLRGKTIGVLGFGLAAYPVAQGLVRLVGLDPEKDMTWKETGEGAGSGRALERGEIDALFFDHMGFGQIEAAGIAVDYLPWPPKTPMIGGNFISAAPEFLHSHRKTAVGFARAILKGVIFTLENPEAAASILIRMFPHLAPEAKTVREKVKTVMVPVTSVIKDYVPYDLSTHWGFMQDAEWRDEIAFRGLQEKLPDPTVFYTNDLVEEANAFDFAAIRAEARAFKVSYD